MTTFCIAFYESFLARVTRREEREVAITRAWMEGGEGATLTISKKAILYFISRLNNVSIHIFHGMDLKITGPFAHNTSITTVSTLVN
jgi:hypothetical protein